MQTDIATQFGQPIVQVVRTNKYEPITAYNPVASDVRPLLFGAAGAAAAVTDYVCSKD